MKTVSRYVFLCTLFFLCLAAGPDHFRAVNAAAGRQVEWTEWKKVSSAPYAVLLAEWRFRFDAGSCSLQVRNDYPDPNRNYDAVYKYDYVEDDDEIPSSKDKLDQTGKTLVWFKPDHLVYTRNLISGCTRIKDVSLDIHQNFGGL